MIRHDKSVSCGDDHCLETRSAAKVGPRRTASKGQCNQRTVPIKRRDET